MFINIIFSGYSEICSDLTRLHNSYAQPNQMEHYTHAQKRKKKKTVQVDELDHQCKVKKKQGGRI